MGCGHVSLKTFICAYISARRGSLKYRLDENLHPSVKSQNYTEVDFVAAGINSAD